MLKAIIFDLDNTLIAYWMMKKNAVDAALRAMLAAGLKVEKKKARTELFELYKKYGIEYGSIFQEFLVHMTGRVDYKILAKAIVAYRKEKLNFLQPYPGAHKVLRSLHKKYKLAIVSDAPRMKTWMRLCSIGLEDYFDVVVTFDDTKQRKPDTLPFIKGLQLLKVKPHEALMVGDNMARDIVGAKTAGLRTALASYGTLRKYFNEPKMYRPPKRTADFELRTLQDLLAVVKKIEKE